MNFYAGELGFLPGQLVFDGNGHVYSSSGNWVGPLPPSTQPAGFSGNFVAAFGREFAKYNMGPVADAFNAYSLLVAKGMTLPAVAPAAAGEIERNGLAQNVHPMAHSLRAGIFAS
jgi:hypothetical protein